MIYSIVVLPGDGIGPEITEQALRILTAFNDVSLDIKQELIGGSAFESVGDPLPPKTLNAVGNANAILFGAVGDSKYDYLPRNLRPEQAILGIRKKLRLFANFRPAILYPQLIKASTLKPRIISNLDILIIRELIGDIYFGEPRGFRTALVGDFKGEKEAYDTMQYSIPEVTRIAKIAFDTAKNRKKKLCSVDKANVLETSQLWRDTINVVGQDYPDIELSHMYIDNAAMQLIKNPLQFDVIVTGNLFGDILSDEASMLTGSIGMLPSASLNSKGQGLYEPIHGSAPDIAGQQIANPLAMILSVAMLFRFSLKMPRYANKIENAVFNVLDSGLRTPDIYEEGMTKVNTDEMGDAVLNELKNISR
ncbi:MAG: 3-isopropylmalate dehydrogenase [Bordetella sp.]|nr:MAG: 3-isopropylmalate dehydrogenase [Bordetella sp.]